jgi:enoyl-CoA hydratase/carnithine racemase
MNDPVLLFEKLGAVARLTLNRPSAMNAINLAILAALEQRLDEVARDEDLRVLIITGSGRAFCAGADLMDVLGGQSPAPGTPDFIDHCNRVLGKLRSFSKPVIAALNGVTMAGGLELAMCADLIVAADSASIGDAHANFGVYPGGGGAAILPRIIPANIALYLLLTGKSLSAQEMKAYGLVCEVHPPEELAEAVMSLAAHIAGKSPAALRRMKEVARASLDKSRDDALRHEQVMLREHQRSFDLQEGLKAFAERRAPEFRGI